MPTCFVMQPFDGGKFDKRFEEIFKPAIQAAELEPYRVDRDPSVSIPVAEIERGIRAASLCLAEITEDNPNVWFELGYAIACNKEVVLVCSKERTTKFPFDVQHRTIIHYGTSSPSDYATLKKQITAKIEAYLKKQEDLTTSVTEIRKVTRTDGLEQHDIVALAVIASAIDHVGDCCSPYLIKRDMEASGYTRIAATIALKSLLNQSFIEQGFHTDESGERYLAYTLTEQGWDWVLANKNKFQLTRSDPDETRESGSIPF